MKEKNWLAEFIKGKKVFRKVKLPKDAYLNMTYIQNSSVCGFLYLCIAKIVLVLRFGNMIFFYLTKVESLIFISFLPFFTHYQGLKSKAAFAKILFVDAAPVD